MLSHPSNFGNLKRLAGGSPDCALPAGCDKKRPRCGLGYPVTPLIGWNTVTLALPSGSYFGIWMPSHLD